jgi:hypothetical protein
LSYRIWLAGVSLAGYAASSAWSADVEFWITRLLQPLVDVLADKVHFRID